MSPMNVAWSILKARGAPKRRAERQEQDQRDLEEFVQRRDKHFADGKVNRRTMVKVRAPHAFRGVEDKNIKFVRPGNEQPTEFELNELESRNKKLHRKERERAASRNQLAGYKDLYRDIWAYPPIEGAKKFTAHGETQLHIPITRERRDEPSGRHELSPTGGYRGIYDSPSEAFDPVNIRQLLLEGFKPSPAQRAQMPEGQQTRQQIKDFERQQQAAQQQRGRALDEDLYRLFG